MSYLLAPSIVSLLSSKREVVGTGRTVAGSVLHGHELLAGYVKVAIDQIDEFVSCWPELKSDECLLTSGCVTAWPIQYTQKT